MIRGLLSDKEWACLEPFAVSHGAGSGRRPKNHRLVLDGIFWIARTGVAWRDLPEYFGKWSSVYRQFRRWTLSGLWELILDAFNDSWRRQSQSANDRQHSHPGTPLFSRR